MKRLSLSMLFALIGAVSVGTVPAFAQQNRHGFWFSGGVGYGSLGCENCVGRTGSWSGGLSLGATVTPKLLLGVGTAGWTKSQLGGSLTVATIDARARFYPTNSGFFITSGAGFGTISAGLAGFGSSSESGVSFLIGAGVDIRVAPNVSLTPFWNGFLVRTSNANTNVGQLGLAITVH
jgi:hypothetical protein